MTIRVGVFGAGGRMGATVCAAVAADAGSGAGGRGRPRPRRRRRSRASRSRPSPRRWPTPAPRSPSTSPSLDAARANASWCAAHGVHAVIGTTGFTDGRPRRAPWRLHPVELPRRAELRHRRRADDALRRAGRAVLRDGRDDRAAPRRQGRRAVRHGDDDGVSAWPRPRPTGRPTRRRRRWCPGARGGRARPASASTRCACGASSPTRRSCSGRRARASPSATTPTTGPAFMPGVLLAVKRVADHPGVTVGLDAFLGL